MDREEAPTESAAFPQADSLNGLSPPEGAAPGKPLSPAARRALDEAAGRRAAIDAAAAAIAEVKERRGRGGLEPVRYRDWEVKVLASDF